MPDETDPPPPIYGYTFGKLTEEEEAELIRKALDDQAVFNELIEASADRELLQDPANRQRLLALLEQQRPRRRWLPAWLAAPKPLFALAGALAVALLVFLVWPRPEPTEEPLTLVSNPTTNLSEFFRLPLRNPGGATFDLHRQPPVFRPGEIVRATLHLNRAAAVFVLRRSPSGQVRMIFPANAGARADQSSGDVMIPFDPVDPTENVTARQTFTLRALVLAAGRDIRTQNIEWSRLGRQGYSAVEARYDVVP